MKKKTNFFQFIVQHNIGTICIVLGITIVLGYFATKLHLNADYSSLMPYGEAPIVYQGGSTNSERIEEVQLGTSMSDEEPQEILETSVLTPSKNQEGPDREPAKIIAGSVTLVPEQTEPDYPRATDYIVMVESNNLFDAELLNTLDKCIYNLENQRELGKSSSVLDFVTIEKKGTRLATVPMDSRPSGSEWTQQTVELFRSRVANDDIVKNYLVSSDLNAMIFTFSISQVNQTRLDELAKYLEPLHDVGASYYINGGSVINNKVMHYLEKDLVTLLVLCFVIILFAYYLSFRSKRSMLIPFSLSVIGIIWTFGTMSLFGYSLTIVNIVTPCMVLTLGSSYSVHVLSEYYSAYRKEQNVQKASLAIKKIYLTILLACLTTISGFLSLLISETPALKEFGIAVSFGVAYCALLSFTYLPAVLSLVKPPKEKQMEVYEKGILTRTINKLSTFVIEHWIVMLAIVLVIFAGFLVTKDKISIDTNYMSYFPASDPFGQESRHFAQKIGGVNPYIVTVKAPEGADSGYFLQPENLQKVYDFQETARNESSDILQCISFPAYISFMNRVYSGSSGIPESPAMLNLLNRMLVLLHNQMGGVVNSFMNEDATVINLIFQHYDSEQQDLMTVGSMARIDRLFKDNLWRLPDGTQVTIGGDPAVNLRFSLRLLNDQNASTILSYIFVFLIVAIALKSGKNGLFALVPVSIGIMANYIWMFVLQIPFDMVTISFTNVVVGSGVDDAIHFLLRFSNKKKNNPEIGIRKLLASTLQETGRPIVLTTVSIVAGMLMLSFASYMPIRYFGLLMSIALTDSMLATIFILPPVMILWDIIHRKLRSRRIVDVVQ